MGEMTDRIERHIEQQRSEFGENVIELRQKVRRSVDWRAQVEERPLMMVGLAFGGGVLLSVLLGGRSGSRSRAFSSGDHPLYQNAPGGRTWEIVKSAAIGMAAAKLKDVVEELLPGFQEHYSRAAAEKNSF